ncbi:MAG: hypothetical protein IID46_12270 [Planctomycetes bacterium]|nr:hypothetical protein [Planctomycetota bacterium]
MLQAKETAGLFDAGEFLRTIGGTDGCDGIFQRFIGAVDPNRFSPEPEFFLVQIEPISRPPILLLDDAAYNQVFAVRPLIFL